MHALSLYRVVRLLTSVGLFTEGEAYRFALGKPHVHLACLRCHSVTHLDGRQLETLQADLRANAHFHVVSLALTVTGYYIICWDPLPIGKLRMMEE